MEVDILHTGVATVILYRIKCDMTVAQAQDM
jgi:hypothetical protein